jgi:hypothetical protein
MTMHDDPKKAATSRDLDELLSHARPEQIRRLLADIYDGDRTPAPTHHAPQSPQ